MTAECLEGASLNLPGQHRFPRLRRANSVSSAVPFSASRSRDCISVPREVSQRARFSGSEKNSIAVFDPHAGWWASCEIAVNSLVPLSFKVSLGSRVANSMEAVLFWSCVARALLPAQPKRGNLLRSS